MNLNNLKPAWKQFLLFNSMQPIDPKDILSIIENAGHATERKVPRLLITTITVIILIVCFQGG